MNEHKLLWIDLETTGGINGDQADHAILECGAILTDGLGEIDFMVNTVFDHSKEDIQSWLDESLMDEVVIDMHTSSGLFEDILTMEDEARISVELFDAKLAAALREKGQPGEFILAGSGVARFDREFLRLFMPETFSMLHYREVDVSSMRTMLQVSEHSDLIMAPKKEDVAHRGLTDAMCHLEEYKQYLTFVDSDSNGNGPGDLREAVTVIAPATVVE